MDNRNYDGILWYKTHYGYWFNNAIGFQHVYVWEQTFQATVDSPFDVIHHINEDKEDNRIENLQLMTREKHMRLHSAGRECTEITRKRRSASLVGHTVSQETRSKLRESHLGFRHGDEAKKKMSRRMKMAGATPTNTSGYKGVYWNTNRKKWHSQIKVNKKTIYLGQYDNPEEAARAYDAAALKHFGDDAFLNYSQDNHVALRA